MSLGIIILLWFWYFCSFHCYGDYRDLHSFPTRRSSDLAGPTEPGIARVVFGGSTGFLRSPDRGRVERPSKYDPQLLRLCQPDVLRGVATPEARPFALRSERRRSRLGWHPRREPRTQPAQAGWL